MFFIPYGTREDQPRQIFPVVTVLLVLINIVLFGLEAHILATSGETGLSNFLNTYAVIPATITGGNPLQIGLLTSMFLHAGLLHLLGNMIYLLPFGDNVEDRLGHLRYLVFYILCGLFATFAFILTEPNTTTPLLGASGAIAGVLGGYLALHRRGVVKGFLFIVIVFIRVDLPAILFIGYWFIMQLFSSFASLGGETVESTSVAFVAHVGGFIAGLILAPIFAASRPKKSVPQSTVYS
ncbi:MAG TPA: rhomboid family intramembrane serine protease [Candidatus Saccharimonadales bacterium]|jgi:membrane associated rhomboid family serine protease